MRLPGKMSGAQMRVRAVQEVQSGGILGVPEVRANNDFFFLGVSCERKRGIGRVKDDRKDFGLMGDVRGCG